MTAGVRYRIEITEPQQHCFAVELTIAVPAAEQIVSLPAWIPGSYLLREFARHLSGLTARQGSRPLEVEQLDKASWRMRCSGRAALQLRYRVYAFDSSVRAAYLDAQRGFFNGTSVCLRVHGREQAAHALELARLPTGWQVATAMPSVGPCRYLAADYDELVDHPIELGRFWRGSFEAGGVEHQLIVSGAVPQFDGERLLADARRICAAQIEFWHGAGTAPPFGDGYTFLLNAVDDGFGGLEHRASSALIAARRDLPRLGQPERSDGYVQLLSLISHEYFHSWNVKRLRPVELAPIDYTRENYTGLLWFFEGFTSYYDDLFLLRAGLIDMPRYLGLLAVNVSAVMATPGRRRQSLAQSSFDAWIRLYRPDENTPNSTISYNAKGALLALTLDLSLRSGAGKRGANVDGLMRALWQRSGDGPRNGCISEADIVAVVAELGGKTLAGQLVDWVHGTDDLPLSTLLQRFAVQWREQPPNVAQRLGLRVSETALTGVQLRQVLDGSAAQAAGFCAGDELIGCNGWRLRRLDEALAGIAPERPALLRFVVARDQRLLELEVELPAPRPGMAPVMLSPADKSPARALELRRKWLGG
jgi:predicted metalloprotease with PDZ domain